MKFYLSGIFLITFLIIGCTETRYEGYTASESGMLYKIHIIGSGKESPKKGNTVRLLYNTEATDTIISFEIKDTYDAGLQEAASILAIGDSATFIIENQSTNLKLLHILTKEDRKREEELKSYFIEKEQLSSDEADSLFNSPDLYQYWFKNGLWQKEIKKGKGAFPLTDQKVYIHYSGYFTDGVSFDSTKKRKGTYELILGQPDQVIEGLEIAISQMQEGSKAKFIIPSQLAFGEGGSSTGIVPPNSIVIYEIELLKITDK